MGEQRITGTRLARELQMSHTAFSRRSTGDLAFSLAEIEHLADLLGVSEAYLLGFAETRTAGLDEAGRPELVRHQGLEPRTRCFGVSEGEHVANVYELAVYRGRPTLPAVVNL